LAHFRERLCSWHADLKNSAAGVPARPPDRLLDRLSVERWTRGWRSGRRRGPEWCAARRERLAKRAGHLHRITVTAVVHVHHVRRNLVEVIVNSRHFKATGKKAGHHRSDFLIEQHQVAHEHRAVTRLLEGGVRSQRETGLDGYALDRDVEIRARHADAID